MKKFLSMTLALIMALALCVPALAASTTTPTSANTVVMNGEVRTPLISVDVPTGTKVHINPYELTVNLGTESDPVNVNDQIINQTHYLTNYSEANVSVGATVTATVPTESGAKLLTAPAVAGKTTTTKDVFLFFDIGVTPDTDTEPTGWNDAGYGYDKSKLTQIVPTAKGAIKTGLVVMEKASDADSAEGAKDGTPGTNAGYAAFHIGGTANGASTETWKSADVVNVSIAFTFTATSANYTGQVVSGS